MPVLFHCTALASANLESPTKRKTYLYQQWNLRNLVLHELRKVLMAIIAGLHQIVWKSASSLYLLT